MPVAGPKVGATDVWFRLRLPDDGVRAVHLCQQIARPRVGPSLQRRPRTPLWEARVDRPPVDRLEYQYELEYADGTRELTIDPHNHLRAAGPFGDRSVIEFPGYRPPAWLNEGQVSQGRSCSVMFSSDLLGARIKIGLWEAPDLDSEDEVPLLIAHDGLEYDRYSSLLTYVAAMVASGRLAPLRVALLPPVDRNEHYGASALYARALAREIVPVLDWLAPQPKSHRRRRSWRVGAGASLGALAMLHAQRLHPRIFGGLFLQSGSFFQSRSDRQESSFANFDRISAFVSGVIGESSWRHPIPVTMTCGTIEENLANNLAVRDALHRQGYKVCFAEHRDGHNWVSWRDAFDPHLAELLRRAW